MITLLWQIGALMPPLQATADHPLPPPADERLLAAVMAAVPQGRILSSAFEDAPSSGRIGCGLIEVGDTTEPYAVWSSRRAADWVISKHVATHEDRNAGGIDRDDRNWDTFQRNLALALCPSLVPPEGTIWVTELEFDPDHRRQPDSRRPERQPTDDRIAPSSS